MKRRELLTLVGAAAAWPALARAQQTPAARTIGFLRTGSPEANAKRVASFRKALNEAGFVDGQNLAIEYRWTSGHNEKLDEMARELVMKRVDAIVTLSATPAAVAAKRATTTIPIYFLIAESPVELGLVSSLNRPGGNATGIITLAAELAAKLFALLRELMPRASTMAMLLKSGNVGAKAVSASVQATARTLGVRLEIFEANTEQEIDRTYAALKRGIPLMVATDSYFFARRARIIALSARHSVPTIYDSREFAEAGGLGSYGPNHIRLWHQAATYVARILKGQKPGDLPVEQATFFELVVNQKTAKELGMAIPSTLLLRADEVIG